MFSLDVSTQVVNQVIFISCEMEGVWDSTYARREPYQIQTMMLESSSSFVDVYLSHRDWLFF